MMKLSARALALASMVSFAPSMSIITASAAMPIVNGHNAVTSVIQDHNALQTVQWRRGGRGWGWYGPGPAVAIAGGVLIGGALVATAIAEHRAEARDMRRCAREFPSFEPKSGTIIGRDGEVRICPYLY